MKTLHKYSFAFPFMAMCLLYACKENIDESNYAIMEGETIMSYLESVDTLSDIAALLQRVRLGDDENASTLSSVLSARGNYTCFFPTNTAVRHYTYCLIGTEDIEQLTYEQAQLIVNSCIIDNKENDAYLSADFSVEGSFAITNLNNRILTCSQQEDASYLISGGSTVINADIEVENGAVHLVDSVIAPSSELIGSMIAEAGNMKIFGRLLQETGWLDLLVDDRDEDYDDRDDVPETRDYPSVTTFDVQQTRYKGYTAFVETDDVIRAEWTDVPEPEVDEEGEVTNWEEILAAITPYCEEAYGTEDRDDLTSQNNAVNRFVAYHFIYGKMAYDDLVVHLVEYRYRYGDVTAPQTSTYEIDVWDYYMTVGEHTSMLKVLQVPDNSGDDYHAIFLNRVATYDNGSDGTYDEVSVVNRGIKVSSTNGDYDNNTQNGFYFPIDGILIYDTETRDYLASERMRIDLSTILDELSSNNLRNGGYIAFPDGYFDNLFNESSSTEVYYLTIAEYKATSWRDYQGDEFLVGGIFDFTLRLPRVPVTGTYELRMGVAMNSLRGMGQIYFGSNPENLAPAGLPYDMRQSADNNPSMPWVEDTGDDATDIENDKNLRNQGYLKGPRYFCASDGTGTSQARSYGGSYPCMRRIITQATMNENTTYYLRFKTVLEQTDTQFFLDYFEIVPSIVYNGVEVEDQW